MAKMFLLPVVALLFGAVSALAGPPTHELDEKIVTQLLKLKSRGSVREANVAMILEGSTRMGPFDCSHVRRVTTVEPQPEGGSRVRRVVCREFHWSDRYGWFLWETREERGGDAVWIWSETEGEVVIR